MNGVRIGDVNIVDVNIHTHGLTDAKAYVYQDSKPLKSLQTSHDTIMSSGNRHLQLHSRNQKILHYVAKSTVTFNVSAPLSRLSSPDGDIAYTSISRQLNASMDTGSFLTKIKSSSQAFKNATKAYIYMLGYKVTTVTTLPIIIVPIFSRIAVAGVAATSINLTVTLVTPSSDVGYISGGRLYCIAMVRGAVPSSIGALKTASSDASSSKGASIAFPRTTTLPLNLNLTVEGLAALQAYTIYCYAETTAGTGTVLDDVVKSKMFTSTVCCRSVKFINTPPYVYSDVTKYSQSSRSLYVFSYELPNAPWGTLKVTPTITLDGNPAKDVIATPASVDFTSVSSLVGNFVLSSSPTTSGDYLIGLRFSGPNATEYSSKNVSVRLLSSTGQVPAPLPLKAIFSDNGQTVLVTFDSPTDEAGLTTLSWPCKKVLDFGNKADSSCAWLNATTVSVTFAAMSLASNPASYLNVLDRITVVQGTLRAFCTSTASVCSSNPTAFGSLLVQAPLKPAAPTVIISAPSKIGACANLSVDASGSYGNGGRPFKSVAWSLSTTESGDTTTILNYLDAYSAVNQVTLPFTISRSQLLPGTYSFSLRLTNFLGASTSTSVKTIVSADRSLPLLTIIGSAYQVITASQTLSILSTVSLSSCVPPMPVKYKWFVQLSGQSTAIISTSTDPRTFSLSSYSLKVDNTYTIILNATTGTSTASESVQVYVAQGPVTAVVRGGYAQSIPLDQELILDASISQDANVQQSKTPTLLYMVILVPSSTSQPSYLFASKFLHFSI